MTYSVDSTRSSDPARAIDPTPVVDPTGGRVRRRTLALLVCALLAGPGMAEVRAADAKDAEFHSRVREAIERGRKALRGDLEGLQGQSPNYPMGRIGLCLAAMLKAGTPSDDPLVLRSFKRLNELPLEKTYSVACFLFALDAFWQQQVQESVRNPGPTTIVKPRTAQGDVRTKMIELIQWLIQARVEGRGVWHYNPSGSSYDHSNTQFAILGLEIGIENGIEIPFEVFREIIDHSKLTATREGGQREVRIEEGPELEEIFTTTTRSRRVRVVRTYPYGWAYHGQGAASESMTAAGASNLLVVRRALEKTRRLTRSLETELNRQIFGAFAWISNHMDKYIHGGNRPYYYTLYSLEKVGDLGNVEKFDGRDWYHEGAEALLKRQRKNGSWGNHADTSFALLFLTRATKPGLQARPPPTILTSVEGQEKTGVGDQVFVDSLNGFISAREFFAFFLQLRKTDLIPVAKLVVRNYTLHRRDELIPPLLALKGKKSDAIAGFCKRALADITGVPNKKIEFYLEVYNTYVEMLKVLEKTPPPSDALAAILARAQTLRHKQRLLDAIESYSMADLCGALIDELANSDRGADREYRERLHGILRRFIGAGPSMPSGARSKRWKETADAWRGEWESRRDDILATARIRRLVSTLGQAVLPAKSRASTLVALAEEGSPAVPFILEAMRRTSYRLDFVLALERITGQRRGLLYQDWKRWWERAN